MMLDRPLGDEGRQRRFAPRQLRVAVALPSRRRALRSSGSSTTRCRSRFSGGNSPLQRLLPRDRGHGAVHAQHLMVARHHLARGAGLALVEQDEVLDDVEQPVMRQHAVEQHLGLHAALVRLVEPLPLGEMLPFAGDRAIAGAVRRC